MKKMTTLFALAALAACASTATKTGETSPAHTQGKGSSAAAPAVASVPDTEIGLAKGSLFETAAPPSYADNTLDPGSSKILDEAFVGDPPQIPHSVADALPIKAGENLCLDCHGSGGDAPKAPQSHYVDLRNAPDKAGKEVDGSRYLCNACHVPVTDAKPLVENSFAP